MTGRSLRDEIAAFVLHEARLLDGARYEEWLGLFADDGIYWAPASPGQVSPSDHVSLFYDDKPTLQERVTRLRHPMIHVQTPRSRVCHVLSEITVTEANESAGTFSTSATFVMLEYRPGLDQRVFGGECRHHLRRQGASFVIVLKRVDLVNCDGAFSPIAVPF